MTMKTYIVIIELYFERIRNIVFIFIDRILSQYASDNTIVKKGAVFIKKNKALNFLKVDFTFFKLILFDSVSLTESNAT